MADQAKVQGIVETVFKGLDETVSEYLVSVLADDPHLEVSRSRVLAVVSVGSTRVLESSRVDWMCRHR